MAPSFINSLNFQWSNFLFLFLFSLLSPENSGREKVHQGQARLACDSTFLLKERENGRERWKDASPLLLSRIFLLAWWRHLLLITSSSNQGQQDLLVTLFLQLRKEVGERDEKMLHPCCSPRFLAWWRHLLSMALNSIKANNNFQIFLVDLN